MQITTKAELVSHIANTLSNTMEKVVLYEASRSHPRSGGVTVITMERYDIIIGRSIHGSGISEDDSLYFTEPNLGRMSSSLGDRHIDYAQNHNETYWFTTRESAEEYINPKPKTQEILNAKLGEFPAEVLRQSAELLIADMKIIPAIKLVKTLGGIGLKEAKDYCEEIRDNRKESLNYILAEGMKRGII